MLKYTLLTSLLTITVAAATVIDARSPRFAATATNAPPGGEVYATGIVEGATRDVHLRPEIVGRVVEVNATIGREVEAGDVLLRLDDRRHRQLAEVSHARIELAQAQLERLVNGPRASERSEAKALFDAKQAQLKQALRTWDRIHELHQQAAVSQQQADEHKGIVDTFTAESAAAHARWQLLEAPARPDRVREAEARLAAADAEHALALIALEKCQLLAPGRASVMDVNVEPGELLAPDDPTPAVILADTSRLRVRTYVEESDAPRLRTGLLVEITADGLPGRTFAGTVESLSPRMSAKQVFSGSADELYDTKVREVLVSLHDPEGLMVGLRVDARFVLVNERSHGIPDAILPAETAASAGRSH